jgi:pimeloyl-ACP methyl ester carboxylesterase
VSLPPPPGLPQPLPVPLDGSEVTTRAVDSFTATVLKRAEENARATSRALESSRKLQILLYVLVFAVGLGTAVAAVVASLTAGSVEQAVAGAGLAGLSAASFFAFFLARPLEALERNAIYSQWLTAAVTAYWTRLAYLDDLETVDADIESATKDLITELDKFARRHAAAVGKAPTPAPAEPREQSPGAG